MKRFAQLVIGTACIIALGLALSALADAQDGQPVNVSISSPLTAYTSLLFYSGTDLQYLCKAKTQQPTATFSVSGSTPYVLTSIVVLTNVGTATTVSDHGLAIGDKVVVSGATGDPDLNTSYAIATVPSSKTFTITTAAVSNGTYNNAALQFTTTAPRSTQPIWAIERLTSVASQVTAIQWANGTSGTTQICDSKATLPYN